MNRHITVVTLIATIEVALSAMLLHAAPATSGANPDEIHQRIESSCVAIITRSLSSNTIRDCDDCTIEMNLVPNCRGEPLNVVLVLLGYANPAIPEAQWNRAWTKSAIDALRLSDHPNTRVGIVYVRSTASILLELTDAEDRVRARSNVVYASAGAGGDWPCFSCGFQKAAQVLKEVDRSNSVIVYIGAMVGRPLIDPDDETYYRDWVKGTRTAKTAADILVVGCPFRLFSCKDWGDWWKEATRGYYFEGLQQGAFERAVEDIVEETTTTTAAELTIHEIIPPELDYIPGSARPDLTSFDPVTGRALWQRPGATITNGHPISFTYRVEPRGSLRIPSAVSFEAGRAVLTDTLRRSREIRVPASFLTITEPCAPIVTPSPSPPATATPPTPSATATPTATPTPTSTLIPGPVYLPLGLNEAPCTREQRADVVLVMDASSSMNEPTEGGYSKLEAARLAAAAFRSTAEP